MADNGKTYIRVGGIVQFDPKKFSKGRDVVLGLLNARKDGIQTMNASIWDSDYSEVSINKGDTLFIDGAYSTRVVQKDDGTEVTYHNVSAKTLCVIPAVPRAGNSGVTRPVETDEGAPF